jgi:hypothetical protein
MKPREEQADGITRRDFVTSGGMWMVVAAIGLGCDASERAGDHELGLCTPLVTSEGLKTSTRLVTQGCGL